MQDYIETWLHLQVVRDARERVSIVVAEDTPQGAAAGRRRIEELKHALEQRGIAYTDSA
jgi:hypothetical protein